MAPGALAQVGEGFDLTWSTIENGGYTFSEGNGYALGGTIGQLDASTVSGGNYTLSGGFWKGGAVGYSIYLPLMLKNYP